METIYSKMRRIIESNEVRYMCNALSISTNCENESSLRDAVKYEIDLALTHKGLPRRTVEGHLLRTEAWEKVSSEELRIVARQWRLDWLQKKHEDACIKFTHEKYLPTTYRAKHRHIKDLAGVKHELEKLKGSENSAPWVCTILDRGQFEHAEELKIPVKRALEGSLFITSIAHRKGAKSEDSSSLTFPDAPSLTRTQYRIGWIDWLLNNTEE